MSDKLGEVLQRQKQQINEPENTKDREEIEFLISENGLDIKMCKGVIRRLNSVLKFEESAEETKESEEIEPDFM